VKRKLTASVIPDNTMRQNVDDFVKEISTSIVLPSFVSSSTWTNNTPQQANLRQTSIQPQTNTPIVTIPSKEEQWHCTPIPEKTKNL
jgi:hypothetical protein